MLNCFPIFKSFPLKQSPAFEILCYNIMRWYSDRVQMLRISTTIVVPKVGFLSALSELRNRNIQHVYRLLLKTALYISHFSYQPYFLLTPYLCNGKFCKTFGKNKRQVIQTTEQWKQTGRKQRIKIYSLMFRFHLSVFKVVFFHCSSVALHVSRRISQHGFLPFLQDLMFFVTHEYPSQ